MKYQYKVVVNNNKSTGYFEFKSLKSALAACPKYHWVIWRRATGTVTWKKYITACGFIK